MSKENATPQSPSAFEHSIAPPTSPRKPFVKKIAAESPALFRGLFKASANDDADDPSDTSETSDTATSPAVDALDLAKHLDAQLWFMTKYHGPAAYRRGQKWGKRFKPKKKNKKRKKRKKAKKKAEVSTQSTSSGARWRFGVMAYVCAMGR